jgi:acyl-CoA ligase (AMP-forming) (exosortase A-associated)
MDEPYLLHQLISRSARVWPDRAALVCQGDSVNYRELQRQVSVFAAALSTVKLERQARVAVFLEKRVEFVVSSFGVAAAGGVFVPVNPVLKPAQVAHILVDSGARVLVTSSSRLALLHEVLPACLALRHVLVLDHADAAAPMAELSVCRNHVWHDFLALGEADGATAHRVIDTDMVAIFYTSGSTGKPKGVVLSHRNMVCGAKSVAEYLENTHEDTLLAALPLSFDAGFSQLTTAFSCGARVVLINYLLPLDVLKAVVRERVTGLTAVPPLWLQLTRLDWPQNVTQHLRYFANTGGRMPLDTLQRLRRALPKTKPILMYGLTEAFRSTYLPSTEIDRRPDSIGRAIPNAEILVLRQDGSPCDVDEPGELVHRGSLVGLGYWNDPEKTAERYRPLPTTVREAGLTLPEMAVFSGDLVRRDAEGYLYFIGRNDEMIKTSGYRVSPTEIEEVLYSEKSVDEVVAFGVAHPVLGQAIMVVVKPAAGPALTVEQLQHVCRERLPLYMQPLRIELFDGALPRNPNGKLDRKFFADRYGDSFDASGDQGASRA